MRNSLLFRHRYGALEPPADTVILELVDYVIERHERVVGIRRRGTEHQHSNTTEAIEANCG